MNHAVRRLALAALYIGLSVLFCWRLFARPDALGVVDWDQHLFYYGSVFKSLFEYGQLPLWNPWYCGGNVLWQNPQVAIVSPAYVLAGFMSLPLAMKVNIVLHYIAAFAGMHLVLTRGVRLAFLPAVVFLAAVFTFSGALAMHVTVGHSVFLPAFYLPLLLFFLVRALDSGRARPMILGSAIVALIVFEGGVHEVPLIAVGVGTTALAAAMVRRDWRPLATAALMGVMAAAYAAPKLLPVESFVRAPQFTDTRELGGPPDRMGLDLFRHVYVDPSVAGVPFASQHHGWHEYGNYIGWAGAFALTAGLLWAIVGGGTAPRWLGVSLAATTIMFLALTFGHFSALAPSALLQHLPGFSSYRVPSRYTIGVVLFGAATAGWAAHGLEPHLRGRAGVVAALLLALALWELTWTNKGYYTGVFRYDPPEQTFRFMARGGAPSVNPDTNPYAPGSPMFQALMRGETFFYCYEPLQLRRAARPDDALVVAGEGARLFGTHFTPNRVEFEVLVGRAPAAVSLNENLVAGWRSSAGPVVADAAGRPSVVLAPGTAGRFAFTFRPPGLWTGMTVFAIALAVSIGLWRRPMPLY